MASFGVVLDFKINPGSTLRAAMRQPPVRAVVSSTVARFFALATKEPNIAATRGFNPKRCGA